MNGSETMVGIVVFATMTVGAAAIRPRPPRLASLAPNRSSVRHRTDVAPPPARQAFRILLAAVGVGLIAGVFAAAITVTGAALYPYIVDRRDRRRRLVAINIAFPDFVDLLVLTIRAGCTPVQAFRALAGAAPAPVRGAVVAVTTRVDEGDRFADAITALTQLLGAVAQPLSDALALADRHGTPLAPTLDRLADESRAQRRRNAELAARQLPVRLSFPLVGCTLPSFVLLTIVPLMAGTLSSLPGLSP